MGGRERKTSSLFQLDWNLFANETKGQLFPFPSLPSLQRPAPSQTGLPLLHHVPHQSPRNHVPGWSVPSVILPASLAPSFSLLKLTPSPFPSLSSPSSRSFPSLAPLTLLPPNRYPSPGRVGIRAMTLRDMKRRQLFERSEVIRRAYLFVSRNETLPDTIRTRAQQALHRMPKKSTPVQVKNLCIKTGKGSGECMRNEKRGRGGGEGGLSFVELGLLEKRREKV